MVTKMPFFFFFFLLILRILNLEEIQVSGID